MGGISEARLPLAAVATDKDSLRNDTHSLMVFLSILQLSLPFFL
jgi:hypothetical protein